MSDTAFCLQLMRRALARPDAQLHGHRTHYERRQLALAQRLIGAGC